MKARSLLGSLVFVAASVLNPAYFAGCGRSDEYQFDAEDVAALLETANGSFETQVDGVRYRVVLDLAPAGKKTGGEDGYGGSPWARSAFACGNRELSLAHATARFDLVASASACSDSSTMYLKGSVAVTRLGADERVIYDGPIKLGMLEVVGFKLSNGRIDIDFTGGSVGINSRDGRSFEPAGLQLSLNPGTR